MSALRPEEDLSPDTRLRLSPDVRLRFDAGGHVLVESPTGTVVDAGPRGLATLELFRCPIALGTAIERLEHDQPATDFAPTMGVITMLIQESALVLGRDGSGPASGWADPVEHARMLHDDRRTGDYLRAIARAVRPDDVVLDIGTGSGVLAVAAAQAGARHVYAVEASDIAEVAEGVFAANGVQDRVTLVRGWSRQVDLPEPADLLVAEIIGSEPLEEEILETTLDARRRLLAPGARLLPRRLNLLARPLRVPDGDARQRTLGAGALERWRGLYGIDFTPLVEAVASGPAYAPVEAETAARWPPAGPAVLLAAIDLEAFDVSSVDAVADLAVGPGGPVNAVAVTFRAELSAGVDHELDPWRWPASSWATAVWILPEPLPVPAGAALRVRYRRRVAGAPDGMTVEVGPASADPHGLTPYG